MRQETITDRYSTRAGFSFFGLFAGKGHASWDSASILTTNPQDVANFGNQVAQDFSKLQRELYKYASKNELAIVYAKAFAAKALQLALSLTIDQAQKLSSLLEVTLVKAQKLSFYGAQNISECITTNYLSRTQEGGLSLRVLFVSLNFGASHSQPARQEKSCSTHQQAAGFSEAQLLSGRLFEMDQLISGYYEQWGLKVLEEAQAPLYPTWGLPAFQN